MSHCQTANTQGNRHIYLSVSNLARYFQWWIEVLVVHGARLLCSWVSHGWWTIECWAPEPPLL